MSLIDELATQFSKFPGIGPRQARRFVYYLLSVDDVFIARLIRLISELRNTLQQCTTCFRFFEPFAKEAAPVCASCASPNTDTARLLVVEKEQDLSVIEKSGVYNGRFFVLGGLVPVIGKTNKKHARLSELLERVVRQAKNENLREIIFALSANPEGDYTATILRDALHPHIERYGIQISVLGRGLSTGTELEYADDETIKNALARRF